jgi:hypothetical protein
VNDAPSNPLTDAYLAPASFAQVRLWFLDRFEPGSSTYHIPLAVRLSGPIDEPSVEKALQAIANRHEPLRTTFTVEDGTVMQVIRPATSAICFKSSQLTTLAELSAEARHSFDLVAGPLWRAKLWQSGPDEHVLQLTFHHIVSDGWSLGVLIKEFAALYASSETALPELSIQYADFATWQNAQLTGPTLATKIDSWCQRLAGADFSPLLETDLPRPKSRDAAGATHKFELNGAVTAQLNTLAQTGGGSLFMALLAGFAMVLQRWSGRDDLVIGTPVANRNRREVEPLIGFFVNTLPLRLSLANHPSGAELFARVRSATLDALADQDVPFEKLVHELQPERSLSLTPLFQVMFVLQNAPLESLKLPGLNVSALEVDTATSKFDLTLVLEESPTGLSGRIEYATSLFRPATIDRLANHFLRALENLVATPTRPVSEFKLTGDAEIAQLAKWSTGPTPGYPATSIATAFTARALATPNAIALTFGESAVTYAELDARANQLAHILRNHGVTIDVPVGICLPRSVELVVALLGILKAGGAYLALDPGYPAARLAPKHWSLRRQRIRKSIRIPTIWPISVSLRAQPAPPRRSQCRSAPCCGWCTERCSQISMPTKCSC